MLHETMPEIRQTSTALRSLLYLAALLVAIAGVQLFVLSDDTATYFAWTIQPPLSAAFFGALFWASLALTLPAAREKVWAAARPGLPAVTTYTTLALVTTLLHLDRFHLRGLRLEAEVAGWAWIAVYVLVPPVLIICLISQVRRPGSDPVGGGPLSHRLRVALGLQGLALLILGSVLFLAPTAVAPFWPWALTPLTARLTGAWLLSLGVAAAWAIGENDRARIKAPARSYLLVGGLELAAVARYAGSVDWGRPAAWVYLICLLSILATGAVGQWAQSEAVPPGGPGESLGSPA